MSQAFPETEENPEALEGEASHQIAAELIEGYTRGVSLPWSSFDGQKADNGEPYTEEMYEGARLYAENVAYIMRESGVFSGPNIRIEERLEMSEVHKYSFGTCDCSIYDRKNKRLYIWDYKFGYNLYEAFENWQCINYFVGLRELYGINGLIDRETTVIIRIVQPRGFHRDGPVREWRVLASDLRPYVNNLQTKAEESLGPNAMCRTGTHCRYCTARIGCTAAISAGLSLFELTASPTPIEMKPADMGFLLTLIRRARKQLEYLESGFEEQVKGLVKKGVDVPGWLVEPTYGRETWGKPVEEIDVLGQMLGLDLIQQKPITPRQAVLKGLDPEIAKQYTTKPQSGIKVVPDDLNKAKRIFSK